MQQDKQPTKHHTQSLNILKCCWKSPSDKLNPLFLAYINKSHELCKS